MKTVGEKTARVDALALSRGKPVFTDDIKLNDVLHLKLLKSPFAHAKIVNIDVSQASEIEGVHAILTHKDFQPHYYTTAGQGYPEPSPRDMLIFDSVVRFVGDRVALVAADTIELAETAMEKIEVKYEKLPAILNPEEAIGNSVILHPESQKTGIHDAKRNIAAHIEAEIGDPDNAFKHSALVLEDSFSTPYVQQTSIEPHITLTWLDENDRLIIRTSTQVPFHVRRIVAEVLKIPIRRIRVIKPRVGGGFGGKQEILNEELCAAITLRTGRPARLEFTRKEELFAARSRHPQMVHLKVGMNKDHTIHALDMRILENTGAYGSHALTVMSVTAQKTLSLYRCPNLRVTGDAVYTNLPIAGAYRGYGAPQGFFALEIMMDQIASKMDIDPVELRKKNIVQVGDDIPIARILGEGQHSYPVEVYSNGLNECLERGKELIGWPPGKSKPENKNNYKKNINSVQSGLGVAAAAQGSGIAGVDMGAVFIKMNEDASFNLLTGATDIGTGSDTALAQIAAEELEVPVENIIVYSSDTDFTPFDTGAYASSTIYISGGAVKIAAERIKAKILALGMKILGEENAKISNGFVIGRSGKRMSYEDICTKTFYTEKQEQIMATASKISFDSPAPYNATFADVSVDTETGIVSVNKIVSITDSGQIINPQMAEGQVEGAIPQSLGMALSEFMVFDDQGAAVNLDLNSYHIYSAIDMPEIIAEFIPTHEPTGPFGAKAAAEIPINGPAPAVINAIYNACGVRIRDLPITPEKILRGLRKI
jgi:putative selenate reductase molybdopterin-binding subunit